MTNGSATKPPHILILDDDTAHQELCRRAFRNDREPFRLSVAGSVADAREVMEQDPPDLIIADWLIPDGKGLDILPRRDGIVTTPLIVMTSHGDEHLAVEIMKSGAIDYVVKSASMFQDLPHIARRALREWYNLQERIRAEATARDSEKRLSDIFDFLPDAIFAINNDGQVIAWNNAMEQMTGVAAADMIGKGDREYSIPFYGERRPMIIDLVDIGDAEIEQKYDFVQRTAGRVTSETFIPTLFQGRGAYLWGTASPLYDSAGNRTGAIEVIRDISSRKRREDLLRQREETLQTLLNSPEDTIALIDRQGIIVNINERGAARFGGSVQEVTGKTAWGLMPPALAAARKTHIGRVFATGDPERFDDERDGMQFHSEVFPVFNSGHTAVEYVAVFARDITDRKKADLALEESERKYRFLVDNVRDIIWQTTPDLIFTYLSPATETITGWTAEELLGKSLFSHMTEASRESVKKRLVQRLEEFRNGAKDLSTVFEIEIRKKDGTLRSLEVSSNAVFGPDRTLAGFHGVTRDITERKRAEQALVASEEKFRTVADYTHDWEYWVLPDGRFFYITPSCERITGYTREEFYQDNGLFKAIIHKDDLPGLAGHIEHRRAEEDPEAGFEFRIIAKNGRTVWIGHTCRPIYNQNGEFLGRRGTNRDITQRKEAESALRRSETRFRALIQNASDIIRVLDTDGRIVYQSGSGDRILGYFPGSLVGKRAQDYIHPDDRDRVKRDFSEVLDRANPGTPTEFRLLRSDGTYVWVDAIGTNLLDVPEVNGIVITIRPIQQRREAEQALRESEDRLRLALEGAGAAFWDWYLPTGEAVFSDGYYTMLEYRPGEFPATYEEWITRIHPDDRAHVLPDLKKQIAENRPLCEIEYRLRTKEGDWIWVLGRGRITETDDKGNPVRMTGVNINITNRKLMESEIRSLNTVLEQRVKDRTEDLVRANRALEAENAQRLAAEGKLQASYNEKVMLLKEIHHRVKNNLQIIASLLNLQSRYIKDEQTLSAIRESQNRVKAMALVHEKLYRAEDISHISLNEYIKFLGTGLFQFYDARARGIQFHLDIRDVNVDINSAIPLGLIINELISNSLKYAFPEGRKGEISITVTKAEHTITILFTDTGIGIPSDLDWQNTQSLGLRLVNTLVDQMNGTIELDRSEGTRFKMVMHEKT